MPEVRALEIGGGKVESTSGGGFRLSIPPVPRGYADAQLDDHRALPRHRFPWHPPLVLRLRARASHPNPLGTLGFGFWNDPFALSLGQGGAARRLPAAPRALWFFYGSPPNDFAFTPGLPGHGWKAASLCAPAIPSLLLAPLAVAAASLAVLPLLRGIVMRAALRSVRAGEALLDARLDEWHEYTLRWESDRATFFVDGSRCLTVASPPPAPLGFVAWIDNQYAVASVAGGFGFGTVKTEEEQWLEIAGLEIRGEGSAR